MEEGAISSSRLAGVDLCVLSLVGSLPPHPPRRSMEKVSPENVMLERNVTNYIRATAAKIAINKGGITVV